MAFFHDIKKEFADMETGEEKLRSFGFFMAAVCALLAAFGAWKGWESGLMWTLLVLALLFALAAVISSNALRLPYRLWMGLALVLGAVVSPVVLGALFFVVLTPISLLKRLFASHKKQSSETYWLPYEGGQEPKRMEELF